MKAWPRYDRDENIWNVYVEVEGEVMPLGTTVDYVGTMPIFENKEFETREDAVAFIKSSKKLKLNENWLSTNLFRCEECGANMEKDSLGTEAADDKEWLECECGHTRGLTTEEIDYNLEMRFGTGLKD